MTFRQSRFISTGSFTEPPHLIDHFEGPVLSLKSDQFHLYFRQWSNQTWALQISKEATPDFFSMAVTPTVGLCEMVWEEDEEGFHLSGPGEIFIDSDTGFLSWYFQGEKVLETENGLGFGTLGTEFLACFHLQANEGFFGLGEKTGDLNRRGSGFTNWNTDAFGYGNGRDPLYVSIPFFLGINQGRCFGLLLDNTAKSRFNFGASNKRMFQISVDSGPMNLVFIPGPRPEEVLRRYHELTGPMPLPPLWSLGLQQCRYSYYPESELRSVARNFRDRDIPCDVLYLDIHYMDGYKVFTEDKKRFPNLKLLCRDLMDLHFRVVPIQDPGIKVQTGYPPYESGKQAGLFVRYPDGEDWVAGVWPGDCVFPDFTDPDARNWWAGLTADWVRNTGVSGLWNDMNEPATWGQDIPDMIEFHWEGRGASHREVHNAYGQKMAESSVRGLEQAYPGKRTFLLTRAGFAGIHRTAAVWTGDNVANEEHLFLSIRMVLGLGMSGVSLAGARYWRVRGRLW
jgi:alpha-glucosidase